MRKFFLFSFLLFLFLVTFTSAAGVISGIPNYQLNFQDYAQFDIETYASGHSNNSNTITFTNPDNNQGVTLFGDVGGSHTNSKFSIGLTPTGLVQMASYDLQMDARNIQVCVGNSFQTQDCDAFTLEISEDSVPVQIASFSTYNLTAGATSLNIGNFFSNFDRFSISYTDTTNSQSVFLQRYEGQGQIQYIGDFYSSLDYSTYPYLIMQTNSKSISKTVNVTVYNNDGQTSATFTVLSHTTGILTNITPQLVVPFVKEYTVPLGTPLTLLIPSYAISYTQLYVFAGSYGSQNLISMFDYVSCLTNPSIIGVLTDPSTDNVYFTRSGNTTLESISVYSTTEQDITLGFQFRNVNGACGYSGVDTSLPLISAESGVAPYNITIHFTGTATSGGVTTGSGNFISNFNDLIFGWFPEESDLTLRQKWGYVGSTFLVILFFFGLLSFVTKGALTMQMAVKLGLIVDGIMFIMFVGLGYIGVGVIISLVVLGIAFIYLKSRGS